ncbi:MAG: glycosyltransferase family 4 protein [Balneolales bacterium]|nr:glycosyltransferase family 4 protein [Balneolales bacterium]
MRKTRRVLMAVHSDYLHDHRVRRETAALTQAGYELEIIAASPDLSLARCEEADGARVHFIPLQKKAGKARYWEFLKRVRAKIGELRPADLIHAHDLDGLLACAPASKKQKARLIYDSHELHTEVHSLQHRPLTRKLWALIENRYIRQADAVITVSEGIAGVLQQRYKLAERPVVVRNFTDPLPVPSGSDDSRMSLSLPPQPYLALYQGVIQHGRGVDAMLRAIAQTPDWGFVICGDGSQKAALEQLAAELGITDRVRFTGMVSRDYILRISRFCHAGFLLTEPLGLSHYYSLPNKLTEYIHYGLPVIATGLPEIRQIVEQYGVGRIISAEQFASEEIASALQELTNQDAGLKEGLKRASADLTWSAEKERLLALYQKLI